MGGQTLLCLCTDLFPQGQAKDSPDIRALEAAGSDTCEAAVAFVKVTEDAVPEVFDVKKSEKRTK